MTDEEFLARVIAKYKRIDELMPAFRIAIKDTEAKIVFATHMYKVTRGETVSQEGSYGLPPTEYKYNQNQSITEELEVRESKKIKHSINMNYFESTIQPYMTSKYPLINPDTGNSIGIIVVLHKVLYSNIQHQLMRALEIYKQPKNIDFEQYNLTRREKELIFLFLNGLSSKEIALVLSKLENKDISKNTIDNIFSNQLRIKFNSFSREALYEKLIELGFDRLIPRDLLFNVKIPLQHIKTY